MTTEHAAEGEAGDVRSHILWQHDIQAFDQDRCQAFGGVRLGGCGRLPEPGQVGRDDGEFPRQHEHIADPMRPRAIAAVEQHQRGTTAPDPPYHAAIAARRFDPLRLGRHALDDGDSFFANRRHRLPH